jgi:hypothetical protein
MKTREVSIAACLAAASALACAGRPLATDDADVAETQANSRSSVFGGTVNTTGGRWWAVKDRLGLDLSASRTAGGDTGWSIGLGWYGLSF